MGLLPKRGVYLLEIYLSKKGKIILEGFGASDCDCISHLIYFKDRLIMKEIILDTFSNNEE